MAQSVTFWGAHYSRHGGFINGVDEFDALFFNISPREAELIDPQERLFLQQAWLAVEDAGYCRRKPEAETGSRALPAATGVYVGVMTSEYPLIAVESSALGMAGGSFASIANRVSYILNINGPSLAVDTMCSSSLTAIDLACRDLASGRTKLALAGGVNLSLHPHKYRLLSAGQFISSRGRCESFGAYGEGYIPGEGVGVLVLKPLADAIADGDAVMAVIKGSALNHGGKTNAYSVPNPNAQREVIQQALSEAGIAAHQVSYVEAHGTGTPLGDPIEITGLADAFGLNPNQGKTCLIGSVKSNIGHCEAAAGVAAITKVLLQMQQDELAPSLHAQPLNPHIDFAATPFAVNQTLTPWQPTIHNGHVLPRIAGISSFGAGGANAHLILQDYPAATEAFTSDSPIIIVVSAKTSERLQVYVQKLLAFIQAHAALDLHALAFTLQTGREAMPYRIALIVKNQAELITKLSAWLHSGQLLPQVLVGAYERNSALTLLADDDDIHATVAVWLSKRKYEKLLALWVQGFSMDWLSLYPEATPKRIHAPTYPFAQEKYWLPDLQPLVRQTTQAVLHPLVQHNISTFNQYCFSAEFTGAEFFLRDHQVQGVATLPGVAYMEMARVAYSLSATLSESSNQVLTITDLVWLQPFTVSQALSTINIRLTPDAQQKAWVQIVSGDGAGIIHCQAWIAPVEISKSDKLPLVELQQRINQQHFTAEDCYQAFTNTGMSYGVGQKSLHQLWVADNQVLAQLALPRELHSTLNDYGLHPSLMDSVLQAAIGYVLAMPEQQLTGMTALPFAVDAVVIYAPCTESMWAWLRFSEASQPGDEIQKFDIDVSDASGNICVLIRGFSLRANRLTPRQQPLSVQTQSHQIHQNLTEACQVYLAQVISDVLKLPMQRLEPDVPLQHYGLDSVMAMAITNRLEQDLASLPKTLLFDYQTLTELSQYLLTTKVERLTALFITTMPQLDSAELGNGQQNVYYPLSEGQAGLWWLQQLQPDSGAYNLPMAFSISRDFDQAALLSALRYVLQQHELLRARLAEQNGELIFVIQPDVNTLLTQLIQHDKVTALSLQDALPQLKVIAKQAFTLNAPLLWRVHVISDEQHAALILVTVHHSIFDGRSVALFMADLWQAYQAFRVGNRLTPTPRVSYADFVSWQQRYFASANYLADLAYWQQQLADMPSRLALPMDYFIDDTKNTEGGIGASLEIHLSTELCQAIKDFALQQRVSVATVYLAAYAHLLHRYTGQDDIVIAMPTLGRSEPEFDSVIGYFINMILLRSRVNDTMTVTALLHHLQTLVLEGLHHSALPLPRLVRELALTNATTQLYQASFAYQNFISADAECPVPELEIVQGLHQEGADWLGLEIYEQSSHHWLRIDYRADLFSAESVQSLFNVYQTLLMNMIAQPDVQLQSVSLLNDAERQHVLALGQGEAVETSASDVSELVLLQAQHTPEYIALIVANSPYNGLSYRELSEQVIALASYLHTFGFDTTAHIGVCVPRGVDAVIAMLALWRVGLVYVPLEPDYPETVLNQLITDAELAAVITRNSAIAFNVLIPIIDLTKLTEDVIPTLTTWPVLDNHTPAYIIYTSGSTGKPKGVVVSRAALSQHCQIMRAHYQLIANDRILQFSSYHVDTSLEQILPGLLAGATLVLRGDELWTSEQAYKVLSHYDVSVVDLPPAYFYELCRDFTAKPAKLRLAIVGGEALPVATVKVWTQSALASVTLINAYGPSEATVTATTQVLEALDFTGDYPATIAIGKALPGYQVVVLDAQQKLVPEGMVGELYIGGSQLALAYWQRQELTEQRFFLLGRLINNDFIVLVTKPVL
ncbi:condensation domain-containing protein [Methylocucumis oryzae]|uniref:condensation domain-containing protein n=1 Tax=Methylocucumis oryzae TaxID=1632867 RepID=UPI0034DF14E5